MKVFEAIPELLRRYDVGHVFGMLGGANVNWAAEGVRSGAFELVKTRHEETAVHAATGYSRATGRIGVCTVTRGPGYANAINGLIAATYAHVPVVLIVGESPVTDLHKASHHTDQNVPQKEITQSFGAGFHHVATAEALEQGFWDAITAAHHSGIPQVLSVNNGFGEDSVELSDHVPPLERTVAPDLDSVRTVVDAIERSQRPLVLAGTGAVIAEARALLVELGELIGARLATTLPAHRFFSGHPYDLGLSGTWSVPLVRDLFAESDLVLAFGTSLNPRTTYHGQMFGGAPVIHCEIDINQPSKASSADFALLGDVGLTARALIGEWRQRGLATRPVIGDPSPTHGDRKTAMLKPDIGHSPSRGLDIRQVAAVLDERLPPDRIVSTDSGRTPGITASFLDAQDARSWIVGNGYGCVGRGLGIIGGAAIARPGRRAALFCGDGGFMMGLAGLDLARMYELDLTIVIYNDQQLGSEVKYMRNLGQTTFDVIRQDLPDIPTLAQAYGGVGVVLETEDDLQQLTIPKRGLQIVDARLDPDSDGNFALT